MIPFFRRPTFLHSHHRYLDVFTAFSILSFQFLGFVVFTFILVLCPCILHAVAFFNTEVICCIAHKKSNSVSTSPGNGPINLFIVSSYYCVFILNRITIIPFLFDINQFAFFIKGCLFNFHIGYDWKMIGYT